MNVYLRFISEYIIIIIKGYIIASFYSNAETL